MLKLFRLLVVGAFAFIVAHPFDGKDSNKFLVNYQGRFLGKIHNSWCNSQCGNNQTFVPMYVKIKCEKTCRPNTYNGLSGTSISNNKIKDDKNTTTNSKKEEEIIQKMTNARRFIDEAELYSLKAERAVKSAEKFEMIANLIIESDKSNPGKVSDSSFNSIKTLQKDIKKQSDLTKTYKKNTDIVANKAKSEISDALRAASDSELSSSTKAMIEESNGLLIRIDEIIEQAEASVNQAKNIEKNADQFPTMRATTIASVTTPTPTTTTTTTAATTTTTVASAG
ncbi:uncharacterized protein LOC122853093 [Aphidius gifuensis]|uniref:uncharacterized protein LOC122853093 n=1 Tax=Aphidius gifuensis TaxID=684658 RepID=UPI001CDD772C|nr:uncharacterized protein LOC122853093 [Aphidius gifuensis]